MVFYLVPGLEVPAPHLRRAELGHVAFGHLRHERAPRRHLRCVLEAGRRAVAPLDALAAEDHGAVREGRRAHELEAWLQPVRHEPLQQHVHRREVVRARRRIGGDQVEQEVHADLPRGVAVVRDAADVNKVLVHVLAQRVVCHARARGVRSAAAPHLRRLSEGAARRAVAAAVPEVRQRAQRRGAGVDVHLERGGVGRSRSQRGEEEAAHRRHRRVAVLIPDIPNDDGATPLTTHAIPRTAYHYHYHHTGAYPHTPSIFTTITP